MPKPNPITQGLDRNIEALLKEMSEVPIDSTKFNTLMNQVIQLHKLKEQDAPKKVSPDTWVIAVANLAGIIFILGHERVNVLTSKALGFAGKLK